MKGEKERRERKGQREGGREEEGKELKGNCIPWRYCPPCQLTSICKREESGQGCKQCKIKRDKEQVS